MAIPSGPGTEVLKRLTKNVLNGATETFTTVPAHHIHTIISINIANNGSASAFGITVNDGSNEINIVSQNASGTIIPAFGTFIYNDRLVLTAGDTLKIAFTGDYAELWVSYIDQDWS